MIIKQITLATLNTGTLDFGYVGENDHTKYVVQCNSVFDDYPSAIATMLIKSSNGAIYPKTITQSGNNVEWLVSASDTAYPGNGQIQLTFSDDGTIVKTVIANTNVKISLVGDDPPPDPVVDWITYATEILEKVDGLTATAEALPTGSDPTATVSTVDGHYNLAFGIPGGSGGDPTEIIDDTAGAGDVTKVWSASKTYGEVTQLKSALDSKAPVILCDASGDIVTFADGADGMPLAACVVTMDASETGRTGAKIIRTGRNMLQTAGYTDVTRNSLANTFCKELNAVMAGKSDSFVISGVSAAVQEDSNTISVNITYSDETSASTVIYRGVNHSYGPTLGPWSIVLDTGKTISSVAMGGNTGSAKITLSSLQLEHGAVGHAYVPYSGTAYSVSWQTEAGTVYDAAELDMVAGTLTVGQDVYQLTDVPTVETVKGLNSIYADCGGISLTYPADTQTYVDSAITAATDPDGNVVQVTGSTPSITGESGKRYVCGTVDSISITPPGTGIIDVVFTSGTTPAVLTASGVTFPAWFDSTSLNASTVYEISIQDGFGAVSKWT